MSFVLAHNHSFMASRHTHRCLAALLLWLVTATSAANARWQNDAYLIKSFMMVAMEREYGKSRHLRFTRWQQPIRLQLINESGNKPLQTDAVKVQAAHLSRITGHPITLVTTDPNVTLIMTNYQRMKSWAKRTMGESASVKMALKEGLCLANFATNKEHAITRAIIIIPVDYSRSRGRLLDCIVEEFTQVMGLPNDSDKVFPSIFNDNSSDSFLTGLDYVLLKLAYHPALKPGMSREEVEAALPVAIKDLRKKGEISQANLRVQHRSLKSWAGI